MDHEHAIVDLVATVVCLLLVAAGTLALVKRIKLPYTVALVLIGIGLSQVAPLGPAFLQPLIEFQRATADAVRPATRIVGGIGDSGRRRRGEHRQCSPDDRRAEPRPDQLASATAS